jgi:protease I
MKKSLAGMRVAILATDMVEESELVDPRQALEDAGAETELITPKEGEILSATNYEKSEAYPVDATLDEVEATDYDAVLLPGGVYSADKLRAEPLAQQFIQQMDDASKPIAVICHGAWLLVSAGLVEGRTLTSYHTLADDIIHAGGEWLDKPAVTDENWVSSRKPDDLPQFNIAMINLFSQIHSAGGMLA